MPSSDFNLEAVQGSISQEDRKIKFEMPDDEALRYWDAQFPTYIAPSNKITGIELRKREQSLLYGLGVALANVEGAGEFTGMNAVDSELGFDKIRPPSILRTTATTETCQAFWDTTWTTGCTYDNWIGYKASRASAIHIDKFATVVPVMLKTNLPANGIREYMVSYSKKTGIPRLVDDLYESEWPWNARLMHTPTYYWEARRKVLVEALPSTTGQIERLRWVGVEFGTGDYLGEQTPTTVAT